MGLQLVQTAIHVRVTCDQCSEFVELCGKRYPRAEVVALLVPKFTASGWYLDARGVKPGPGVGRWYCPTCARGRP